MESVSVCPMRASTPPMAPTPAHAERSVREERRADVALQDAALVGALRRGDDGASLRFARHVEHAATATLLRLLGPGDRDHEDLVQLTLERVVSSVLSGAYEGRCGLATWASVIATRLGVDALRKRRTERGIFREPKVEESVEATAAEHEGPERSADAHRKLRALRRALAEISPDKAETVVLFEVMGHDLDEIARLTGVSVAAAQSRLVRGRKELKERLVRALGDRNA